MLEDSKHHQGAQADIAANKIAQDVELDDATVVNFIAQNQVEIGILENRINALQMVINLERRLRRNLERQVSNDESKAPAKNNEIRPAQASIIEQATAKKNLMAAQVAVHDTAQIEISINTLQSRLRALQTVIQLERKLRRAVEEKIAQKKLQAPASVADTSEAVQTKHFVEVRPSTQAAATPVPADEDDATIVYASKLNAKAISAPASTHSDAPSTLNAIPESALQKSGEILLPLPIGFKLLEYRIEKILGRGGFGITYLATDIHLNTKVAIKEYLPGDFACRTSDNSVTPRWPEDRDFYQQGLDGFLVEARTLATFRHPNIVRVARFFEAHRTAYMVLEYERGQSLKEWWASHKDLTEIELLTLIQPLLDGLAMVHESGYLHRDIKPDNIYVRRDDGSLVLLDFGSARLSTGDPQEMANAVTPGYAPVEQYEGAQQTAATDIYALGATLYAMITGNKPPAAPDRLDGSKQYIPAQELGAGRYSPEFLKAIDWALQLQVEQRPPDMQTFRTALFAAHASSLDFQEALRAGDVKPLVAETWRDLLRSPRLFGVRIKHFFRTTAHPSAWSLSIKIIIAMVMAALLPMVITAYYNLNSSLTTVNASELRDLEQHAQSAAGRVSQLLNDSRNLANYLGTDQDFVAFLNHPDDAAKIAINAKLAGLAKSNADIHPLIVMDADGKALASSDATVTGRNFKFREYFKQAMMGHPHMTGLVVGSTTGTVGVYYSNPVINPDGKVIGAVVLRIKGESIAGIMGEIRRANLVPFMIDGDGVLIYHPNRAQLYKSLVPLSPEKLEVIVADQRFRRNKLENLHMPELAKAMIGAVYAGNVDYVSTISGKREIAGYAPVKGHDWVLGVSESHDSFEKPLNLLFYNAMLSLIVIGLIFMILAVLFARSIVKPIERLTMAAHALKSGDYDKATIKVTSGDEIGKLARTFNVMIDVLRQREREQKRKDLGRKKDLEEREFGG